MSRELIVASNPKRRTSAKQRAAARRNIKKAQAALRRKTRGTRKTTRRRKNPSRPATRRKVARAATRRRASVRRSYQNPVRLIPRNIVRSTLMPAAIGGAGAVGNDVIYSFVLGRLPVGTGAVGDIVEQLRSGPLRHAGRAASALVLGWLASFAVNRRTAEQMSAGAITVVGYNVVRELAARFAPNLPLGAYIEPEAMGAYISPNGMGWAGAGRTAGGGTLNPRTGYRRVPGLAAYISPRLRGMSQVPQLTNRGQFTNADPFTARRTAPVMEGYGDPGS
jgi:hypothetical protein